MAEITRIAKGLLWLACLTGHARADIAIPEKGAKNPQPAEEAWAGVAVARQGNVVAIWSAERVLVSDDGGRRFRERLSGKHEVDGVAVSAEGKVFVVRGQRLGTATAGGEERWKTLPFRGFASVLAAGAGRLVWIGHQRARPTSAENNSRPLVAVSPDEGATWAFQRPSEYQELYLKNASVGDDGRITIDATFGDCRSWDAILRGRIDGRGWREDDAESSPGVAEVRDGRGRAYRIEAGALERRERGGGAWTRVSR
jgi:hypothetical protein